MEPASHPRSNICGQIAVAGVLMRLARSGIPGAAEPGVAGMPHHSGLPDPEMIEGIRRTFPPDVPFGFGTSVPRLIEALHAHGIETSRIHGGWFGARAGPARDRLVDHLASGRPAIVCLDHGLLGGRAFVAHWAVAWGTSRDGIMLDNVQRPSPIPWDAFMPAWRARQLPFGYNHCALLVRA